MTTIRSTAGRVAAYAWLMFAALNFVDLVVGITGEPDLLADGVRDRALLLLGCGIAYTVGLRPAIVADEAALTVRNPLRDVRDRRGPRSAGIEGPNAVTVRFAGADGRSWRPAPGCTRRRRAPRPRRRRVRAEEARKKGRPSTSGDGRRRGTPPSDSTRCVTATARRPSRALPARPPRPRRSPPRGARSPGRSRRLAALVAPLAALIAILVYAAPLTARGGGRFCRSGRVRRGPRTGPRGGVQVRGGARAGRGDVVRRPGGRPPGST